jgi:hypothetical protein
MTNKRGANVLRRQPVSGKRVGDEDTDDREHFYPRVLILLLDVQIAPDNTLLQLRE